MDCRQAPPFSKLAAALLLTVFTASCVREAPPPRPYPDLSGSVRVGTSVEGRPIHELVLGTGEDTTLILGTIHGNENAGTPLVHRLAGNLRENAHVLKGRQVVIVPVVNPDGYARNIRTNARGIDLNRNFAATNRLNNARFGITQLSEPESKLIVQLLDRHQPDRIISIHQPLNCIDYDGPAEALAEHMAQYCYLPVKKLGSRPGSLGSYAGVDRKIPIITLELPRNAKSMGTSELWARYGRALLAAITWPDPPPESFAETRATRTAFIVGLLLLVLVAGIGFLSAGSRRNERPSS